MKKWLLILLLLFPGCGLMGPTYKEIGESEIARIAAGLGLTLEEAMANNRAALKAELSEDLGMRVETLFDENGKFVAEIEPAVDDAVRKALKGPMENPTQPEKWITGGVAGLAVLLMGVLGLRGKKKNGEGDGKENS